MTDPLTWSPINLGRWSGTQVRVHFFLIVFVLFRLLSAIMAPDHPVAQTICWLGLLIVALAIHELGHALMASWLGVETEDVRLWPLGNLVGPSSSVRSSENAVVAFAGPLTSALMVLSAALTVYLAGGRFIWSPFGNKDGTGAPLIAGAPVAAFTPLWWVGWFGYLNWVVLIANLIPALPFDGGRILRALLAGANVVSTKDNMLAPWTARSCAALLVLVGLARLIFQGMGDGITLIGLAILIELIVRAESRMLEDGGFFEDGVFGYDFTEGYTSLESSAAKVRPYRESALKRWRRRRSDVRRQRRQAREAAEERRMDEILEKLHREGRSALTDEEQRFLVRVSAKYRNRPRSRG